MALILVVEQENRYIERIRDALTSEGWQVRAVGGSQEALSCAEREPPQLVLVSRESEGCDRLFQAFSRRTGGPGVVALLPESATHIEEPAADDALAKPFTDQDLRLAVRRGLKPKEPSSPAPPQAPASPGSDQQLSAQDIFGDLVAEMESELQGAAAESPPPPAADTSPARASIPPKSPSKTPPPGASKTAPAGDPKRRTGTGELDLEKTLSGLRRDVELGSRPNRPAEAATPVPKEKKKKREKTDTELDVDALLSQTLSSIDLPTPKTRKKKDKESPPPSDPAPIQAEPAPPAQSAPEPPAPEIEPPTPAGARAEPEESSLADLLLEEDDVPPPTQVQPPPDLVDTPSASPTARTGVGTGTADGAGVGTGIGAAEPGPDGAGEEPPAPIASKPREKGPEREISFSDLSAPSLQEVPEPLVPDPAAGPEISMELNDLGDMEGSMAEPEGPLTGAPAETDLRESSGSGYSLADWLESGEDSMFAPDESASETKTDTTTETPSSGPGDTGSPATGDVSGSPDQRFGQYMLLDRIAVGGMAEVWKARSTGIEGFQKTVAIKKILPHLTDNDDFVNMFIDEAKLAAQLSHPNIIHIYDLGKIGDHFYIAMEYVEGKNLRALLNESRRKALPLPRGLALLIAARLASALDHAHRKKDFEDRELGLVHRDVSPQNVLISDEGDIKLCDFGIVKAVSKASQTQMGALKGKLQYMSPEQAWGKDVDARSDLFSLGAILFEMLTGRRLFVGDSEISVLEAVRQCRVVAPRELVPQIPERVEAITLKALAMEPDDRYQTAGEMQTELEDVLYSVKPAPSPADLAEFLQRLTEASEAEESDLVPAPGAVADEVAPHAATGSDALKGTDPAKVGARDPVEEKPPTEGGSAPGREALASPPPVGDSPSTERPRPEPSAPSGAFSEPDRASETTGSGTASVPGPREAPEQLAATAMPAMADYDLDELEEGGGRGKLWLVVLIVALLALGAAGFYYVYFVQTPTPAQDAPETEAPTEPPPEPAPSPLDEVESETLDDWESESPEDGEGDRSGERGGEGSAAVGPATRSPSAPERGPERSAVAAQTTVASRTEEDSRSTVPETRRTPTAGPRKTGTPNPTEPRSSPPRPSLRGPTPETTARSPAPSPAAATGTDLLAQSGPTTPPEPETPTEPSPSHTVFTLREEASPPPSPPPSPSTTRPASSETADSPTPEATRPQRMVALRQPVEPEREPQTESEAEPPAETKPQEAAQEDVREGDLVGPGPGVTAPVLVRFDKPSYPPLARRMKVEGDVVVSLLVDEDGRVVETRLIRGVREGVGLHQVALDAARRARYRPATKNGVRVKMWTTLRIPFRL